MSWKYYCYANDDDDDDIDFLRDINSKNDMAE